MHFSTQDSKYLQWVTLPIPAPIATNALIDEMEHEPSNTLADHDSISCRPRCQPCWRMQTWVIWQYAAMPSKMYTGST